MSESGAADFYRGYADWKQWQGDFAPSERDARYFSAELAGLELAGRRVLEIGFGNGSFMAWVRARGALVTGTEIDTAMIAHATAKGFDAQPAPLDVLVAAGRAFDLVLAFDVFEHWHKDELIANLRHIHALLVPGGRLLARFPNGHSPFGRVHQYGDLTHVTVLSASSMRQLAAMTGFEVQRIGNACSVPVRGDAWSAIKHRWRRSRRARIETYLGKLYGIGRLPLDPNLVAVLAKPAERPSANEKQR